MVDWAPTGIGRIVRKPWTLHVGSHGIDIDDLRKHDPSAEWCHLLGGLDNAPTAAECLWVLSAVADCLPAAVDRIRARLVELVLAREGPDVHAAGRRRGAVPVRPGVEAPHPQGNA